jgi:CRP-like cAMP-binding protein
MYLILKGSVYVLIPEGARTLEGTLNHLKNKDHSPSSTSSNKKLIENEEFGVLVNLDLVYESPGNLKIVRKLFSGDHFGDLALHFESVRTASVICAEDCHFAVLDKQHYREIIYESIESRAAANQF